MARLEAVIASSQRGSTKEERGVCSLARQVLLQISALPREKGLQPTAPPQTDPFGTAFVPAYERNRKSGALESAAKMGDGPLKTVQEMMKEHFAFTDHKAHLP